MVDDWIDVIDRLPVPSLNVFYLAVLTQEHMCSTNRSHPYDVVSGWYLNSFPKLYERWMPLPDPPRRK